MDCAGKLRRIIAENGPITIAEFMRIALADPQSGYYVRRNPISGDFITAPEISQLFGELIGLFFVQLWEDRGRPARFHLVELGPGRGTLMSDMLRAARIRPDFVAAGDVHLVEISPVLRAIQRTALASHRVAWHTRFSDVAADAPLFIVANEFFDALPVRQFIRECEQWRERKVALDRSSFCFTAGDEPADNLIPNHLRDAPEGSIFELSEAAVQLCAEIASRIMSTGGAALIIDYGHIRSGLADTLQAVKAHQYADPLQSPGDADITCHVDFDAAAAIACGAGAEVFGPITQRSFLTTLGIRERAERLKQHAPGSAAMIDSGVERLVSEAQMGNLFKVLGLSSPGVPPLPGFPC
jgi:NADH dehydrogenase [ubiquinone] 1 alpha subcomplex assembly factor 7